jgi:hypothetical protein
MLSKARFVRASSLRDCWNEDRSNLFNTRGQEFLGDFEIAASTARVLVFVSHRWDTPEWPDMRNEQVIDVLHRLELACEKRVALGQQDAQRLSLTQWAHECKGRYCCKQRVVKVFLLT